MRRRRGPSDWRRCWGCLARYCCRSEGSLQSCCAFARWAECGHGACAMRRFPPRAPMKSPLRWRTMLSPAARRRSTAVCGTFPCMGKACRDKPIGAFTARFPKARRREIEYGLRVVSTRRRVRPIPADLISARICGRTVCASACTARRISGGGGVVSAGLPVCAASPALDGGAVPRHGRGRRRVCGGHAAG